MKKIKVLVVDDSMVFREVIARGLSSDPYIEVVATAQDPFDARNKIVHEIKKSDSHEEAHVWQVKYYLFVLERNGIHGAKGILEYPKMRETNEVILSGSDREAIVRIENEIQNIIASDICPDRKEQKNCKNCSYFDFCWSGEE
jgi:CRISPR-associated exonuclease Cas4